MLGEYTGLSTHTLSKVHNRKAAVDLRTLVRYFGAFNLILERSDYTAPNLNGKSPQPTPKLFPNNEAASWGLAPDVSGFCGRTTELDTLDRWVREQHSRLIVLSGMGGMGKTWLAAKLAEQVQDEFKKIVWRRLQPIARSHSPRPFSDFVGDLICSLTSQPNPQIPKSINAKTRKLMDCLRHSPFLLVLDNVESVLPEYCFPADSQQGLSQQQRGSGKAYGELFKQLAQGRHQSCVVLTSRLEPISLRSYLGDRSGCRVLPIRGLQVADIQEILQARGTLQGTATEWRCLASYYGGNPLILGIVTVMIRDVFAGRIADFLSQDTRIDEGIGELLGQQLNILPIAARDVLQVLARQGSPLSFPELRSRCSPSLSESLLFRLLSLLRARSLIEVADACFSLQPLLADYVATRL